MKEANKNKYDLSYIRSLSAHIPVA